MSGNGGLKIAAAVGVALVMASGAHGKHHHGGWLAELDSSGVPWGSSYTPRSWARAFLRSAGLPMTRCNVRAVMAWEAAEGGNWQNSAHANPLNTTEREPGSYSINPVGVQSYTSWHQGMAATVTTLGNGNYPGIISAFRAGGSAQAAADAVASSPWGTGSFSAAC